jgi:hypothetical protein
MTAYTLKMSAVWPVFSRLTNLWQKEVQSQGVVEGYDSAGLKTNADILDWPNAPVSGIQRHHVGPTLQQGKGDPRGDSAIDLEGFDVSMSGLDQPMLNPEIEQASMPAGLSVPMSDPSPSFHGDDVDAIFHNLAHLDTTDWTNDRQRGLQEFGFADESTFQDFCNDPERMVVGGTPFGRLGNEATATFWPPPGIFPGHFEEPDPQVEASQILQSLSNNDSYPTLPEGVGW